MEKLTLDDISLEEKLYFQPQVSEVYRGYIKIRPDNPICLKKVFIQDHEEANRKIGEVLSMAEAHHPHVTTLISAFLETRQNSIGSLCIIMEYFEEGDLQILIDSKINSSTYWTEPELLNYASQLIDPLYHLQTKGISHRDLKPKNIFVSKQGTFLKIGDFGLSIKVTQSTMTAVGTPLYVSPLVRSALARAMESGSFKVHHNPFKSDVYSLGLILLYMTTLKSIEDLCSMSTLETKINQRLSKLEDYPILKTMLEKMLKVNESERCDFNELYRFMIQVKTGPLIECLGCRIEKPKKEYFIVKSGEYMCRDCTLSFEHFPEQKILCQTCSMFLEPDLECNCCSAESRCFVCKNLPHNDISCIESLVKSLSANTYSINMICTCRDRLTLHPEYLYFYCTKCQIFLCLVCGLPYTQKNHEVCHFMLKNYYNLKSIL